MNIWSAGRVFMHWRIMFTMSGLLQKQVFEVVARDVRVDLGHAEAVELDAARILVVAMVGMQISSLMIPLRRKMMGELIVPLIWTKQYTNV
jgi:hypothetical protein